MSAAFICDGIRTPIGKFAGALSRVRTDDLAAIPLKAILERNATVDPECIDEVILGCANQAGLARSIKRKKGSLLRLPFLHLVEAAGVEPASASTLPLALHA